MRSSSRLLSSSKSETQGQLSGCGGVVRSHFGLLHRTRGTVIKVFAQDAWKGKDKDVYCRKSLF